jgi:hypothetical protein
MPNTSRSPSRSPSRSRRSYPNLHSLSLAPLSAKYTLDDASSPPDTERARTSYIAQKSAPTTPGILSLSQSRSNSRNGRRAKAIYAYDGYFQDRVREGKDVGDIPKAKSTTALLHAGVSFADEPVTRHHTRKGTAPLPLRVPLLRHHTTDADDEWWHRAGLAIAGETRDSKGQGWLVRRESATSLVQEDGSHEERDMVLLSGEHLGADDFPTFSPMMSRVGSRAQSRIHSRIHSRVPSARQSRRGSRVGSRVDLAMTAGSTGQSLELPSFDMEPDFIQDNDESDGDEEEVARLARERGFGLGGWVDKLVGWTLFSVDEDGESSDDEPDEVEDDNRFRPENMTQEELRLRREVEAKRRKMEREAIIAASARKETTSREGGPVSGEAQRPPEEGGGWQDAAWLLSVASKALF